jgi:hypothetical protein
MMIVHHNRFLHRHGSLLFAEGARRALNSATIIALSLLLGVSVTFKIYYILACRVRTDQPVSVGGHDTRKRICGAPVHCRVPPVLPTERIAHVSAAAACCAAGLIVGTLDIHGRNLPDQAERHPNCEFSQ